MYTVTVGVPVVHSVLLVSLLTCLAPSAAPTVLQVTCTIVLIVSKFLNVSLKVFFFKNLVQRRWRRL